MAVIDRLALSNAMCKSNGNSTLQTDSEGNTTVIHVFPVHLSSDATELSHLEKSGTLLGAWRPWSQFVQGLSNREGYQIGVIDAERSLPPLDTLLANMALVDEIEQAYAQPALHTLLPTSSERLENASRV